MFDTNLNYKNTKYEKQLQCRALCEVAEETLETAMFNGLRQGYSTDFAQGLLCKMTGGQWPVIKQTLKVQYE